MPDALKLTLGVKLAQAKVLYGLTAGCAILTVLAGALLRPAYANMYDDLGLRCDAACRVGLSASWWVGWFLLLALSTAVSVGLDEVRPRKIVLLSAIAADALGWAFFVWAVAVADTDLRRMIA